MSSQIVEESRFLFYCFLSGIIVTIAYDFFRIFRRVVKHGTLWIAFEDIIFWIFATFFLFYVLYKTNHGMLRWFSVAGAGIGMLVYKYLVGEYIVEIMSTLIKKIQDMVFACLHFVFKPVKTLIKHVFGRIKRLFKKLKKVVKKKLTGNIKKFKITLCKHKKHNGVRGQHETKSKNGQAKSRFQK